SVTIGVPRLPHISNFTDLEPLARSPGVRVEYLPLDAGLEGIDGLVLPGTKNTVDDRLALEDSGFDATLKQFRGPIVGICGGYQLLGERITNASIESTRDEFPRSTAHPTGKADAVDGLGLLPVETRFEPEKRVRQVTLEVTGVGPIAGASGTASGYEIHMGRTEPIARVDGDVLDRPLGPDSAATESVLGTYLHGIFENPGVREAFLESVFDHAEVDRPDQPTTSHSPYDAAAALVEAIDESWLSERLGQVRRATEADR
ncbi:MAG: cobyric acid synthase CobQ, partial [Natronomonas sp.]